MSNDEFLKEVLKYGKIRPVEEAFKMLILNIK